MPKSEFRLVNRKLSLLFIILFLLVWSFCAHINLKFNLDYLKTQDKMPASVSRQLPLDKGFIQASLNPSLTLERDWSINEPVVSAQAAIIVKMPEDRVLFQKNIYQILPIASLTKIITALVVFDKLELEDKVSINRNMITFYPGLGRLKEGEKLTVYNLLQLLLMESSNDAALALAKEVEDKNPNLNFINLMNQKVHQMGLENTYFTDPTGYSADNTSNAYDLVNIIKYSLRNSYLWQILGTQEVTFSSIDGQVTHHVINNNHLLRTMSNILGGKTGYTEEAGQCIVAVSRAPNEKGYLITVVLHSKDRFEDARTLIEWSEKAYKWQ